MKVILTRDWFGPTIGEQPRQHKSGERISVLHWPGSKLLRRHGALWLGYDEGDPQWPNGNPPAVFCFKAAVPEVDKMIHRSTNK